MKIEKFEDILSWQKAKELTINVYREFASCRDFAFKDQIQRASVSIMNNIAEGFERKSNNEFKQFLFIAKGSCGEVRSILYLAKELNYLSTEIFNIFFDLCVEISKLLSGLIKTLKTFNFMNFKNFFGQSFATLRFAEEYLVSPIILLQGKYRKCTVQTVQARNVKIVRFDLKPHDKHSDYFNALPAGNRNNNDGSFNNLGTYANFWSSLPNESENAWNRNLNYNNGKVNRNNNNRTNGFSVRCSKDWL